MRLNLQAVWWIASLKRPPNAVADPGRAVYDWRSVPEAPGEARRLTRDGFRGSGKSGVVPLRPRVGTQYAAEQTRVLRVMKVGRPMLWSTTPSSTSAFTCSP